MVDVFISYSRQDQPKVALLAKRIAAEGYDVWWDQDLPAHMSYGDVITAKVAEARAAVVVWSKTAAQSEWVRAEADMARNQKKLIQTALDDVLPPLPFNQIQCALLGDWRGEPDHPGWTKVKQSLAALCGPPGAPRAVPQPPAPPPHSPKKAWPDRPPPPRPKPVAAAPTPGPISNTTVFVLVGVVGTIVLGLLLMLGAAGSGSDPVTPDPSGTQGPPVGTDAAPQALMSPTPVPSPSIAADEPIDAGPGQLPADADFPSSPQVVGAMVTAPGGSVVMQMTPSGEIVMYGTLAYGDTVRTFAQDGPWWLVELNDGTLGFVDRTTIALTGQ